MLDLEVAGDFILMASTLMHIKVRMLLPREFDEKGEEIDPRAELVKALLEYKRYKEVTEELAYYESNQRKMSFRGNFSADEKVAVPEYDILLKNVTIYDLAKAFKHVLDNFKEEPVHQVARLNVSIEEQISFILSKFEVAEEINFLNLVSEIKEKIRIIVTFIAILELVKMSRIKIKESDNFNDFVILKGD
jgi:segregation and condensation protein A